MQQAKASMYVSPTQLMVISPKLVADVHQHVVIQFTCSLDGTPFSVWTEKDGWQRTEAVLINSDVAHSVKDFEGWQVTLCMIPDARKGRRIQEKLLQGGDIRYYLAKDIAPILSVLEEARQQFLPDSKAFHSLTDTIYNYLLGNADFDPPLDERITRALLYIRQHIHESISAAALAAEVHLSEHRFLHLFKEQVGAPLRQYVLWIRLAAGIQAFVEGRSAKEAAYEAGFSDPAHFSRTFQQLFGGQPSMYAAIKTFYHIAFFEDF